MNVGKSSSSSPKCCYTLRPPLVSVSIRVESERQSYYEQHRIKNLLWGLDLTQLWKLVSRGFVQDTTSMATVKPEVTRIQLD